MSLMMTPNGPAIMDGSDIILLSDALDAWYFIKYLSDNMHVTSVTDEHTTFEITCTRGMHEAIELHGAATECDECDGTLEDSFEEEDDARSLPRSLDAVTSAVPGPPLISLRGPAPILDGGYPAATALRDAA